MRAVIDAVIIHWVFLLPHPFQAFTSRVFLFFFADAGLRVHAMSSEGEHAVSHHRLESHTSRCRPTSIDQLLTGSSLREQAD